MNIIVKYPLLCPVDGGIIGGIVSGIGSMIGSGINARAQKQINKDNIKAQQKENQLNREFTEDMYNKYESPVAQRQQMLEAGVNPMGAIAPQSVGSASTSALPPGQAPQFGSAIQDGIQAFFDAGSTILAQGLQKQEIKQKELENWRLAFENGNAEELYEAQLKALKEQTAYTRAQKRAKNQEIKNLKFTYLKAKEAYEKGHNEFIDAGEESDARVDKIRQEISSSLNSMINDNIRLDIDLEKHDIFKSFADLEYKEQEQLLKELLDTWEVRESLINSDKAVRTMIVGQLQRADELQNEKHKYDMAVAKNVATAVENGDPVDAVLLKHLAEDPSSALALTAKIVSFLHESGTNVVKSQNSKNLVSGAFRH